MLNFMLIGTCSLLAILFSLTAEAKLYKWVDDKGITHYGEIIPPEYANSERDSLKKSGLLEKRQVKVDPSSTRANEEAEQKKNIDNQKKIDQQRRNNALLNTYSNEKEIDQALDRSLILINARIESNKMLLKSSQKSLEVHKKEFESRTKSGKIIPASLNNDIAQAESKLLRLQTELNKSESELGTVKDRFDKEKELYKKLKSGSGK